MKRNALIACAVLIAGLAACNNQAKDSTATADSINHSYDSANKKAPVGGYGYSHELSDPDSKFAVAAANGGMAEVELGRLAMDRGNAQQVKDFGAMMVNDHSHANEELKTIAAKYKVTLPAMLNNEEQKLKDDLSKKSGADFDKAYIQAMIEDHETDIKDFEQAQKVAKYPEIIAFIGKTLPVLKSHLSAIQKVHDQVK